MKSASMILSSALLLVVLGSTNNLLLFASGIKAWGGHGGYPFGVGPQGGNLLPFAVGGGTHIAAHGRHLAAGKQVGGTCYAWASAAALHGTKKGKRMCNRGDMPELEDLRNRMIKKHGKKGAVTYNVLKEYGEKYGIAVRDIGGPENWEKELEKQLNERNEVMVLSFRLSPQGWARFNAAADRSNGLVSGGILASGPDDGGHAMLVVGWNNNEGPHGAGNTYIKCMNSWGENCGDEGFMRIPLSVLEDLYYNRGHEVEFYAVG